MQNAKTVFTELVLYCRTMDIDSSEMREVVVGLDGTVCDRRSTRTDGRNTIRLADKTAVQQCENYSVNNIPHRRGGLGRRGGIVHSAYGTA